MNAKVDSVRSTTHEYPTSPEDPLIPVLILLEWMQDETASGSRASNVRERVLCQIGGSVVHAKGHACVAIRTGTKKLLEFACPFPGSWRCLVTLLAPTDGYIYWPSKTQRNPHTEPDRFMVATGEKKLLIVVGRGNYGGYAILSGDIAKDALTTE